MDETGMVALVKQYGKTRVSNMLSKASSYLNSARAVV